MTKRYAVAVREVHIAMYFVEAESPEEARQLAGAGHLNPDIIEYSHLLGDEHTVVTEEDMPQLGHP